MAGDWIKMRGSLMTHPKILRLALSIGQHPDIGEKFLGKPCALLDCVTRDVTRDMVIGALLRLWSATNEHTSDGVWKNVDLQDLDEIAGIPEFCKHLSIVGWLEYDEVKETATLPNFLEYNSPAKNGARSPAAQRQADYRARKQGKNITNCDVTRDVTVTPREEKRREENNNKAQAPFLLPDFVPKDEWEAFIEMRKKARKAPTERAKAMIATELAKLKKNGEDVAAVLLQSVRNNWVDVYPVKDKTKQVNGHEPIKPVYFPPSWRDTLETVQLKANEVGADIGGMTKIEAITEVLLQMSRNTATR